MISTRHLLPVKLRFCTLLVCAVLLPSLAQAQMPKEVGIDRSNLTNESETVQETTLQDIHALHATWFRDVLPAATLKFVNEVKLAKQNDLKFLVNVLPTCADYDNRCGALTEAGKLALSPM